MRIVIAVLAVCFLSQSADAQIFPRAPWNKFQAQVSSSCPGGICPTNASSVLSAPQQRGHWSYPGTIESHLESTHGVATAGMTRQQKLNLHDSLHEGTVSSYRASAYGAPVIVRSTPVQSYGSTGSVVQSYGSTGTVVQRIAPVVSYGSSTVTVVAQPSGVNFIPAPTEAFSEVVVGTGFKAEATKAIIAARKAGSIASRDALRLRVAMLSPAFAKNAEELAVIQMTSSGENPDAIPMNADGTVNTAGINWEGRTKFLEKFIPLLLAMLKALGLGALAQNCAT